jgi:acyl carrier protein
MTVKKVSGMLADSLKDYGLYNEDLRPQTTFPSLLMEDLDVMDFLIKCENEFGIEIAEEEAEQLTSIQSLADLVDKKLHHAYLSKDDSNEEFGFSIDNLSSEELTAIIGFKDAEIAELKRQNQILRGGLERVLDADITDVISKALGDAEPDEGDKNHG